MNALLAVATGVLAVLGACGCTSTGGATNDAGPTTGDPGELCSVPVGCGGKGATYRSCTTSGPTGCTSSRFMASDGSSFACVSCSECQVAASQVASWCQTGPIADLGVAVDLAASPDLALLSACGHPGDVGNSLGVGRFCTTVAECAQTAQAKICSTISNGTPPSASDTYFCTMACDPSGPNTCGEGAHCIGSGTSGGCLLVSCQ
jgi:hypothetical protein